MMRVNSRISALKLTGIAAMSAAVIRIWAPTIHARRRPSRSE
jgi:hypothetical protein